MGCNPTGPTSPAGVGIKDPENLEAIQTSNGLWWLAVSADPERIAIGTFGSEMTALAHRQWLIDQRKRMAPVEAARTQAAERLNAGLELARAVDSFAQDLAVSNSTIANDPDHAGLFKSLFSIRCNLSAATSAYRKAVGQ